jgi:hypothetical protein
VAAQDDAPAEVRCCFQTDLAHASLPPPWLTVPWCVATQGADADAEAEPEPVKCPVGGGGFQELYAVAVLLSHQDKLAEAEVCLSDAITTTVPAYRMLSDIATVNSAQIPVPPNSPILLRATEPHNCQLTGGCNACLAWCALLDRSIWPRGGDRRSDRDPYKHRSVPAPAACTASRAMLTEASAARVSGDAKLYYARKLLRVNENECVVPRWVRTATPRWHLSPACFCANAGRQRSDWMFSSSTMEKMLRFAVSATPTHRAAARERSYLSQTLSCDASDLMGVAQFRLDQQDEAIENLKK